MSQTIIYADLLLENFEGPQAELYVNDIPVARAGGKIQPWASESVHEYLVDGVNTLAVIIGIGDTPAQAKVGAAKQAARSEMKVWARIVRLQEGEPAEPGAGEALIEIKWAGVKQDSFPVVLTASKDLGQLFGTWKWESADVLTLDSATYESAVQFLSEIQGAYTAGKPDPMLKVMQFRNQEVGRAYPAYGEITDEMFREQIGMASKEPNWKPYSLPRQEYDLRLAANGRLIQAIATDWRPVLRMEDGDYAFPLFIGKVKGDWQILR